MRLSLCVVLGALLAGSQASFVARKQDSHDASDASDTAAADGINDQNTTPAVIPTVAPPTSDSAPTATPSTPPSNGDGSSSSTTTSGSGDSTVTVTDTVTSSGAGSTVTKLTTSVDTSTTTVFATHTVFTTITVTSSDEQTATKTVFSTDTVTVTASANQKRFPFQIQNIPTPAIRAPAFVEAVPTATPLADFLDRRNLERRATQTVHVTVTVGSKGGTTTVTNTLHKTVVSTLSAGTTLTSTITSTEQANAKTTVTTTSVLTVTSTVINNGLGQTLTDSAPAGDVTSPPAAGSNGSGGGGGGSPSKGLSTGAKVGIGIGAGAGGLAILGLVLWLVVRNRNQGYSPDPDDLVGASEVPVGPSGRPPAMGGTMSANAAAASALLGTGRHPPGKPVSAEGYRGTAMGDGRAGFAKPDTYGAPYPSVSPAPPPSVSPVYSLPKPDIGIAGLAEGPHTAELGNDGGAANKWYDPNASEIDGRAVMSHQSGPVYEMPEQAYR